MSYVHIAFSCQCNIVVCTVHTTFFDIVHTTILHWHGDMSFKTHPPSVICLTYIFHRGCKNFIWNSQHCNFLKPFKKVFTNLVPYLLQTVFVTNTSKTMDQLSQRLKIELKLLFPKWPFFQLKVWFKYLKFYEIW